jgi:hypothetical protein
MNITPLLNSATFPKTRLWKLLTRKVQVGL